ncbi:MAG TPA: hypothetical protein VGZ26_02020, partial [Pirellulales bacterium]|nr:hypothetical protein [Pirellulales bacterium]
MSTLSDADRYLEMNVELVCPKCGSAGLIPWQRLDRALYCRACSILFRVDANRLVELEESPHERILVQVRSSSSEWRDHQAVIEKATSIAARLRTFAIEIATGTHARWGALCGAILLIVASLATIAREPPLPSPLEIPTRLEERAVLLAEALARRDMKVLIALTDPSQHRALRIWLAHGKDLPEQISDDDQQAPSKVLSMAVTTAAGDSVDVRVRLPSASKEFVLKERWVQQGAAWYFRPV